MVSVAQKEFDDLSELSSLIGSAINIIHRYWPRKGSSSESFLSNILSVNELASSTTVH